MHTSQFFVTCSQNTASLLQIRRSVTSLLCE